MRNGRPAGVSDLAMRNLLSSFVLLVLVATPGAAAPAAQAPPLPGDDHLVVRMERTACMGKCARYDVAIYDDGTVVYHGKGDVAVTGEQRAKITARQVKALAAAFVKARFSEMDNNGQLPIKPVCHKHGDETECETRPQGGVVCSDTSHAIIFFQQGGKQHRIDDEHCVPSPLDKLEALIDTTAGARAWIASPAAP